MPPEAEGAYRAVASLEKRVESHFQQIGSQLARLDQTPVEVATLKETAFHHRQNVERIQSSLDDCVKYVRDEIKMLRETAERAASASVERDDGLSKSIASVADRIEQKFGTRVEDLKTRLGLLTSDYDKRIAAIKAVSTAVSVGFFLLQGVAGLALSSYVNGWKSKIEDNEVAMKEVRRNLSDTDARLESAKKIALESQRRVDELENRK